MSTGSCARDRWTSRAGSMAGGWRPNSVTHRRHFHRRDRGEADPRGGGPRDRPPRQDASPLGSHRPLWRPSGAPAAMSSAGPAVARGGAAVRGLLARSLHRLHKAAKGRNVARVGRIDRSAREGFLRPDAFLGACHPRPLNGYPDPGARAGGAGPPQRGPAGAGPGWVPLAEHRRTGRGRRVRPRRRRPPRPGPGVPPLRHRLAWLAMNQQRKRCRFMISEVAFRSPGEPKAGPRRSADRPAAGVWTRRTGDPGNPPIPPRALSTLRQDGRMNPDHSPQRTQRPQRRRHESRPNRRPRRPAPSRRPLSSETSLLPLCSLCPLW
jgi:hypothetical protein